MSTSEPLPNDALACSVVSSMTGENVISAVSIKTGDQNFVYAANTEKSEYVIRMTNDCRLLQEGKGEGKTKMEATLRSQ